MSAAGQNATTGVLLRVLEGHKDRVMSVAFSPDGTRIVSGSSDLPVGFGHLI
jgi:WD40 repeat protein